LSKRIIKGSNVMDPPRQLCIICAIVQDLLEIAQEDLRIGRFDDVGETLAQMRAQITGDIPGYELPSVP
jgi:hypothetical protein